MLNGFLNPSKIKLYRTSLFNRVKAAVNTLFLFLIMNCAGAAAEGLTISVARSPLSLPLYIAQNEGYFVSDGLQVKINDVIGGPRAFKQLADGEADLATASEAVVMFNSFKRNDFNVIATFVTSNDDVKVVTRKGADISRPEQFAGKRVGTIPGSASHYFLDTFLTLNGIDPKQCKIVALQPEAMSMALKSGEVDAIVVWEPYAFEVLQAVEGAKIFPNMGAYVLSFNLISHAKHKKINDEDLIKLLRALDKAQKFIKTEPSKAQAILRNRLQLDQAFVDWIWPRYNYRLSLDQVLISTMESEARWARQEGHVVADRSPNYLEFIYTSPLRKVKPDAVGVVE